ncbi:MAG: preprotein translocase subunit YajC [Bacteroidota bacterium]|jgi:preprotein translocase subunit YajC
MNFTLLQAAAKGGGWEQLIFFVPMIAIFYFFMIRPQMKKQKEQKKLVDSIAKGDKIVTLGGIQAKVTEVNETYLIIESEGTKLRINRSAVSMEATVALNPVKKEETK